MNISAEQANGMALPQARAIMGVAILLMFAHHLFGLPSLIKPENAYIPLISGLPIEYWIGRFGKICVAIFLIISGYGFATRLEAGLVVKWRYYWQKIGGFLFVYWYYLAIVLVIGAAFFQRALPNGDWRYAVDPASIVLDALTLQYKFAYEWWFAQTYILLVALTPLLHRVQRPMLLGLGSTVLFALGSAMDVAKVNLPYASISNLLIWQWPFTVGWIMARWTILERTNPYSRPWPLALLGAAILTGFALCERHAAFAMTPYLIAVAPFCLILLYQFFERFPLATSGGPLPVLGRWALPLWLVHPFFCYHFFQSLVYAPRWSIIIFLNLLLLTGLTVVASEFVRRAVAALLLRSAAPFTSSRQVKP